MIDRFLRGWFTKSLPQYGQFSLWILLVFCLVLATLSPPHVAGARSETWATCLGFLPESLVRSLAVYHTLRVVLVFAAVTWALGFGVPWVGWLTALSFTAVWSLRMENVANGAHIFHATNMLLWIHAMWYHFYRSEILEARRAGTFWITPLYPRWVFLLVVFYLGWFHSWAGWTKLAYSGWDWGNGLSLQLWVSLWGWSASPFGQLVLASRWVASCLQTGALVIESLSFLAWFGKWPRLLIGLGLLGFYTGVLGTFVDYGFHFNALLVAWYLLPVESWVTERAEQWRGRVATESPKDVAPGRPATV